MVKANPTPRTLTTDEQRLAQMLKALGNPVRFQILQILAEKQMCITGEIVDFTTWPNQPSASTSKCCAMPAWFPAKSKARLPATA